MSVPQSQHVPSGMSRRHFLSHLSGASALSIPALVFANTLKSYAAQLRRNQKSAILLWMGGGPSTIDIWDLKPGAATGGVFQPISTVGDVQICEHLPMLAKQMNHLSIVRSMSTREADHARGRYYMHTGYVPNPSVEHPSYGSVIAHQLMGQRPDLEIPPFVSIGGSSVGPGFLGMAWSPFVVNSNGRVRNLDSGLESERFTRRMSILRKLENRFISEQRGQAASDHQQVLAKSYEVMTSQQMSSFRIQEESASTRERYGNTSFGRGCLMARRLVETGAPFVEVDFGGWDNHQNIFTTLQEKLPVMDRAMSALIEDLDERGMLENTVLLWMGEFGRTPRINGQAGRDHWARSWSAVLGGAGIKGGLAVGQTNEDGSEVATKPYKSQDLMATVCHALGIPLDTVFKGVNGRPFKIANKGSVIGELLS